MPVSKEFKYFVIPLQLLACYILFIFVYLPSPTAGKPGWLKYCDESNESTLIHAGGCSKGAILKEPVNLTCVCVFGVWVLAQSACDKQPIILVGTGDCFNLESTSIISFKFIGRPSNPFSPGTYIGTSSLTGFWKVPTKGTLLMPRLNVTTIVSIKSDKVISAKNIACCIPDDFHIDMPVRVCLQVPFGDYVVRTRCHYSPKPIYRALAVSISTGYGIKAGDEVEETMTISASSKCAGCAQKRIVTRETDCCKALQYEDETEFAVTDLKRYDKQTNRMALAHLDFTLQNKKTVTMTTPEFTLLRYSAHIMSNVCPSEEVPKELLKAALRFFKQAVYESVEDFPMERTVDEPQHQRILSALQTCFNSTKDGKARWKVKYVEGSCKTEIEKIETSDGELDIQLPLSIPYDTSRYDAVVETAWKIVQFVHYFCSRFFEDQPTVGSYLITGLERLFNADILKRWLNPGKTYDILQFLLPTENLEKFFQVIDACVAVAKSLSVHKQWLIRPASRPTISRSERSTLIWNKTGVCLMSYWHPSDFPMLDYCHQYRFRS